MYQYLYFVIIMLQKCLARDQIVKLRSEVSDQVVDMDEVKAMSVLLASNCDDGAPCPGMQNMQV